MFVTTELAVNKYMKNNFIKNGFTLVELLTTIAIMTMLLAIVVPSYNNFGRSNELDQVGQTVKSAILATNNYALSPRAGVYGLVDYKIVFENIPGGGFSYTIYEDTASSSTVVESSKFSKIYSLNESKTITYSLTNRGQITASPNSTIEITNSSLLIQKVVNINVDTLSGNVVTARP